MTPARLITLAVGPSPRERPAFAGGWRQVPELNPWDHKIGDTAKYLAIPVVAEDEVIVGVEQGETFGDVVYGIH